MCHKAVQAVIAPVQLVAAGAKKNAGTAAPPTRFGHGCCYGDLTALGAELFDTCSGVVRGMFGNYRSCIEAVPNKPRRKYINVPSTPPGLLPRIVADVH